MFGRRENHTVRYVAMFAVGAAVGAAVALLFAPMPGRKLQRRLRNTWKDGKGTLEDLGENFESVMAGVQDAARTVQKKFR
jgi:gas vesicle protein